MTYTTQFPISYTDDTYVKANNLGAPYRQWFSIDPTKSVTGILDNNSWYQGGTTGRFHIDLGTPQIIRRLYYENLHSLGGITEYACKTFTLWGSNNAAAFADITYGDDANWNLLVTSQPTFDQHVAADVADPKYILVTNIVPYQYYAVKVADSWGGANMGWRRMQFQTEDGFVPPSSIAASRRLIEL